MQSSYYNVANLNDLIEVITPKAHVDFGVWGLCLGNLNLDQILPLSEAGVCGFKYFWGYAIDSKTYQLIYNYQEGMKDVIPPLDEGEIYKIFREVAKTGQLVGIHAENFYLIKMLSEEVKASGDRSYAAVLRSRPPVSEMTVIETGILFAEALGTHLHILHLASGDAVRLIRDAQKQGINVTAETCPHYLALTDKDFDRVGALLKGYPPIRTQHDQDLLWEGLNDGTLSFVCSDNAPHSYEEKMKDYWDAPAGMTNIEIMGPVMINAVNQGKLTINQLAAVMSENQPRCSTFIRKRFARGGYRCRYRGCRHGCRIYYGSGKLHSRTKLTPFTGLKMKGKVDATFLRGKKIVENGEMIAEPGGKFIRPNKK